MHRERAGENDRDARAREPTPHAPKLCGTIGRYDEAVAYFERAIEECRRAATLGREAQRRAEALKAPLLVMDAASVNSSRRVMTRA